MPNFITLSCPSCGHKLQITEDVDRFACAACGNEHIVNRSDGIITLKPVIDSIKRVQVGVDKTASELAIVRLNNEIDDLENEIEEIMDTESRIVSFTRSKSGIVTLIFFFIFGVLLAFGGDIYTIFGLFLIGMAIISYIFGKIRAKEDKRDNEKEAKPLRDQLKHKLKELAEHQQMVNRNN